MNEIWLPIIGYEGYYEVSNLGKVKRVKQYQPSCRKKGITHRSNTLKNCVNNRGYVRLLLSKDGVSKSFKLARLVAFHFIENPNNLPYVNHIDGNKTNDISTNLEWCSQAENVQHAYEHQLRKTSEGIGHRIRLNKEDATNIREIYNNKELNQREIAEKYNVSLATINGIINNKIWIIKKNQ